MMSLKNKQNHGDHTLFVKHFDLGGVTVLLISLLLKMTKRSNKSWDNALPKCWNSRF